VAVLYSGGADSTCAAILKLKEFDKVHLITYNRFGLFHVGNATTNAKKLKDKFGQNKFIHITIDLNKLFREVSYAEYIRNFKKHGFFLLSTCGLCKLAMHIRTLIYCLDNDIKHVCDGANKNAIYFPAQMPEVIREIKKMYAFYGIIYTTPIFNFDELKRTDWIDKLGVDDTTKKQNHSGPTSEALLFEYNLFSSDNIKGTKIDRQMQPRCFQFILFNIFLHWYYLPTYGFLKYKKTTVCFYKEKIEYFKNLIDSYLTQKEESRLFKFTV